MRLEEWCQNEVGTNAWVKPKQRCNNEEHKKLHGTKQSIDTKTMLVKMQK
jgi:hypothetical protein